MAAAAYDPGKATVVTPIGDGKYTMDSFRSEKRSYLIDLPANSCTCPHWQCRLAETGQDCKHLAEVKRQQPYLKAAERAASLTDEALARCLQRYGNHPVIGGALRVEREERRRAAAEAYHDEQEARREASEAKVWKSTKVFGPTTDEEAFGVRR